MVGFLEEHDPTDTGAGTKEKLKKNRFSNEFTRGKLARGKRKDKYYKRVMAL